MTKKAWLVLQLTSMFLLIGGGFSLAYFSNEYPVLFRQTLLQNHLLVVFLIFILLGLGYIMVIAEVRIRTGKITKTSSVITIGVLCLIFLLAYTSN